MTRFLGLGELPGADVRAAADVLAGEVGDIPHLPVLPARGVGSDAVGRTAALCADLSVDAGARAWRITDRPGHAQRIAADHVERDLDVCEEFWGTAPGTVVAPVVGPWTLAASIELSGGHRMLVDRGAVAYLAESLAAGLAAHVADVRRRFGADVIVAIAEPAAGAVAAGAIPDATGGDVLPAVGHREMSEQWRAVTGAAGIPDAILALPGLDAGAGGNSGRATRAGHVGDAAVRDSGAASLALPLEAVRGTGALDAVGAVRAAGIDLVFGAVPARPGGVDGYTGAYLEPDHRGIAERVARLWDELSFPRADLVDHVDLTVAPGFASAPADWVAPAYAAGREAAELMGRAAGDL